MAKCLFGARSRPTLFGPTTRGGVSAAVPLSRCSAGGRAASVPLCPIPDTRMHTMRLLQRTSLLPLARLGWRRQSTGPGVELPSASTPTTPGEVHFLKYVLVFVMRVGGRVAGVESAHSSSGCIVCRAPSAALNCVVSGHPHSGIHHHLFNCCCDRPVIPAALNSIMRPR